MDNLQLPDTPPIAFGPGSTMLIAIAVSIILGLVAWRKPNKRRLLLTIITVTWLLPVFELTYCLFTFQTIDYLIDILISATAMIIFAVKARQQTPTEPIQNPTMLK